MWPRVDPIIEVKMSHENVSESLETQLNRGSKKLDDDLKPKNKGGYTRNVFNIVD